jgi:ketosteroid isomerase-like protein
MRALACVAALLAAPWSPAAQASGLQERTARIEADVRTTEAAFAQTMADRDHAAFVSFLAEDAIFLGQTTLRGKAAVAEAWKAYYEAPAAPFAWKPERVVVIDDGSLALSTGPVMDPAGKRVGTFVSTWRRQADGTWRVVFDGGCPPCPSCPSP